MNTDDFFFSSQKLPGSHLLAALAHSSLASLLRRQPPIISFKLSQEHEQEKVFLRKLFSCYSELSWKGQGGSPPQAPPHPGPCRPGGQGSNAPEWQLAQHRAIRAGSKGAILQGKYIGGLLGSTLSHGNSTVTAHATLDRSETRFPFLSV